MSTNKLPFQIPESLASYVEQYEANPKKTIDRFKKQLERRGSDAIGFFILAWFYHQQAEKEKALKYAVKAKTLAPGSPFLEKAPYFLSHPQLFDAWQSDASTPIGGHSKFSSPSKSGLNSLIERLSNAGAKKIKVDYSPGDNKTKNQQPFDEKEVEEIVSETLAKVHGQQGNNSTAPYMYKTLRETNKDRSDFYEKKIKELEQLSSIQDKP